MAYVPLYQSILSLSGSCPRMDVRIEATDGRPEKAIYFDIVDRNTMNFETCLVTPVILTEKVVTFAPKSDNTIEKYSLPDAEVRYK